MEDGAVETKTKDQDYEEDVAGTWKQFTVKLRQHMAGYLLHRHLALATSRAFDAHIDNLKIGDAVVLMDFGQNYAHVSGEESQDKYWSHEQTTIHPVIVYRRGADGVVWAESHCFISPDRKHDNRFVVHCIKQLLGRLHAENNVPKRIMFWSDGW